MYGDSNGTTAFDLEKVRVKVSQISRPYLVNKFIWSLHLLSGLLSTINRKPHGESNMPQSHLPSVVVVVYFSMYIHIIVDKQYNKNTVHTEVVPQSHTGAVACPKIKLFFTLSLKKGQSKYTRLSTSNRQF